LSCYLTSSLSVGREASIGRKVAIKKIKVGQFKDGLDMSAIREVKYLRELKHQNIIEASPSSNETYNTCPTSF
jgi:serine/threonine protein kinase